MVGCCLILAAVAAAGVAPTSLPATPQQPAYGPEGAWVQPLAIPAGVKPSGAAADSLLVDMQSNLAPGGGELFLEYAVRINAPSGLQQAGNLVQAWDPATQTLTIHRARILRGDKVIDLLADGRRFTVLRRETNLEAAVIDGQLTATLQPEGLQVGDIVDFAITVGRHEPALAGHAEGGAFLMHTGVIARLHTSISWPSGMPVRLWKTDDLPPLTPIASDTGARQVVIDRTDAVSPEPPKDAPVSAQLFGIALASDFSDWKQVSATAYPLYAKAATLQPRSPLNAEIARIRAAGPDAKTRTLAALELVESQTRYLAVMLNAGGLTPAPADLTWARRFGDCKGKVVLMLALLHGLGIQAEPALVSTVAGENLSHTLAELSAFDHVIVRAEIAGRTYWLDPTRIGDENLDIIPIPNYRWALPLRADGAELEALAPPVPAIPLVETIETVDLTAGMTKPARVHEDLILRGDGGWSLGMTLQRAAPIDRDRALKAAFANSDPWVTPDKVGFTYDPQKMEARLTLEGSGSPPFTTENQAAASARDWMIGSSGIGYDPDFARRSDYHRDALYAVAYPAYTRGTVDVRLPANGKGFEAINGGTIARTIAGVEYSRAAMVAGDRFTMVASSRAIAQSFPASEAAGDAEALRSLADYQVSLRSSGVVAASPAKATSLATPASAFEDGKDAFRRGDYTAAEALFSKALSQRPFPILYYDRGASRAALGEKALAKADFEAALKLDPNHANASYALGRYAMEEGKWPEAAHRFADASRQANSVAMLRHIAGAYEDAKRFSDADPFISRAASQVSDLHQRAALLNTACWDRATAGQDLQQALDDCDASIPIAEDRSQVLDSRALVELRLSRVDAAVKDYTSALETRPMQWTSLYGRGLAERKQGNTKAAADDLAAALTAYPSAKTEFTKWGLGD